MLISYIKRQYKLILMLALFAVVFASVFALYDLQAEAVFYAASLCLLIGLVLFFVGYRRYLRTHRELKRLLANVEELSFCLPPPQGALEADYQALVRSLCQDRARIVAEGEDRSKDMLDYFTLWVHQIKTPVAAMSLLLQTEEASREAMGAELLKIEQYVEMVLTYLRLGGDSTDYVLRRCSLDELVRACARRYAKLFVLKKISLRFDETGRSVLTDEKWLSFVVGQLLSNAIKYTPEGGEVRVYGDGQTLVVSDTGIGIREEDLPRVFEKGFTGQNGRAEKKSTGIGLYLCRRILDKLGGSVSIVSRPGKGTIVRVLLPEGKQVLE
ncbi:sensor histidine kinase [Oscillibacter sp. MSJ-2]|uniref:histidine kinase n=1 Tax=Dysosmobacter acutus TaxID=2841504 RepID=A0ABS6FBJ4_9FIRM|nr:sensor histidine kinase [Dysosmobacter acutus]MBU5627645.1 sensor histidine kinase [Dysosmobacter acutus]